MAIQHIAPTAFLTWEHYEASSGSYRATDHQGLESGAAEIDPFGADAGLMKPLTWPQANAAGKLNPYYDLPELNGAFSGCVLDGVPVPCAMASNDNSMQCEKNHCGPVLKLKRNKSTGKVIDYELS